MTNYVFKKQDLWRDLRIRNRKGTGRTIENVRSASFLVDPIDDLLNNMAVPWAFSVYNNFVYHHKGHGPIGVLRGRSSVPRVPPVPIVVGHAGTVTFKRRFLNPDFSDIF